ncbi:MAG: exonuclease SbcD [Chloroflexi bacterium]|jgi:exonuclease SbcD|nr:MAG: exonuclease SbcD [Chloroflexota bacterium]
MKILHFSDVHIGVENYGVVDPETGLSTRLQDFLDTYDEVVNHALENQVDLVLFSGDAYKSRDPSQTHQREFAKRIATLTNAGIPVFLLIGNHDLPSIASRATALDIFPTLNVPGTYVSERLTTTVVDTKDGPLQVVSLPWIRRSAFLAREETHNLTLEQINQQLQDRLTTMLQQQIDALDQSIPAVLTAHVSLNTAVLSSEQTMMLGHDHVLLQSNLANPAFDYVALGHIHKHQILWQAPLMAYSGSLQRIDFGEEKDPKGFCIIDIDPTKPRGGRVTDFQFIPVDARRFVTINVSVEENVLDPTTDVIQAIQRHNFHDAIVRLIIRLPEELETRISDTAIRQALKGAHYIAAIQRDVIRQRRPRLAAEAIETMTPTDVLKRYMEEQEVPEDRQATLLRLGQQLIQEAADRDS